MAYGVWRWALLSGLVGICHRDTRTTGGEQKCHPGRSGEDLGRDANARLMDLSFMLNRRLPLLRERESDAGHL
jgi:hypothetical protein